LMWDFIDKKGTENFLTNYLVNRFLLKYWFYL